MTGRVDGNQLRWYRANFKSVSLAIAMISVFCFGLEILTKDVIGLCLGIVAALMSLVFLASSFIAGIGAGADGILVRRIFGQSRWVPWTEIQRFDFKERAGRVGISYQIAVIRKDGTRLTTGVWANEKSSQRSRYQTFNDLEADRLKANHRLGLPS